MTTNIKMFEGNAVKNMKYGDDINIRLHVKANDIVSANDTMKKSCKKNGYEFKDIYEVEEFTYDINTPSVVKVEEKSEIENKGKAFENKGAEVVEQMFAEEVGVVDADDGEIIDVEV